MNDGVTLTSAAHPRLPWYKRWWYWLHAPVLSPESLETVEVEIKEPAGTLHPIDDLLRSHYKQAWANAFSEYSKRQWTAIYPERTSMNDQDIEKEIQAKGLTAPRVTLAQIESTLAYEYYITGEDIYGVHTGVLGPAYKSVSNLGETLSCLTLCVLVLKNGFKVTGESSCVDTANFNAAIGRKLARQQAIDKVWMLEGYLLKQQLTETARKREAMRDPAYKTIGD